MPTLNGTDGNETLTGGAEADTINGRSGTDVIDGGGGADTIQGGNGADTLNGGDGNDVLYGFGATDVNAQSGQIVATRIATGFADPLFAASAPGDPDRLFVVEQHTGRILILDTTTGQTASQPFLDIPNNQLAGGSEQGLLGFVFHPDYAANGKFYVNLTNAAGDTEIWEYTRSEGSQDVADPGSRRLIMTFDQPETNHNGGWLGFGPDGYLYISSGDGGGRGDPDNNAQNTENLLGKILRIDIDGDDFPGDATRNYAIPDDNPFVGGPGADEVWVYGLRNPWRPSFDRLTGDLYIADVGQGAREELNFIEDGTGAGLNFGWRIREGDIAYSGETGTDLIDPILVYPNGGGPDAGESITGGYVYRGPGGGGGLYFFGDFVRGNIWTTQVVDGEAVDFINRNDQIITDAGAIDLIASFAEDGLGRLYVIGLDGEIFRLAPSAAAGDGADVLSGGAGDDRLYGGAGADRLMGDGGDDQLSGGLGDDRLFGGLGDDLYVVDSAGDVAIEADGQGADVINASVSYRLGGSSYIERLILTGSADIDATGNGIANILTGNAGSNVLNGKGGADKMVGGLGNDTYFVDDAGDVVTELNGQGTDTVFTSVTYGLGGSSYIETLTLMGSANIGANGNGIANTIVGNGGNNVLAGKGGADTLTGSAGVDTFKYNAISDSSFSVYDRITDLTNADRIDLSGIDANTSVAGDQAFSLAASLNAAGRMTLTYNAAKDFTLLSADVNGDGVADIRIVILGDHDDFTNFIF